MIVEEAIGTTPDLGLVIIDGIRDFLYDINSSSESTEVISKFMQWTDDKQIHIHTVLHQNKNDEHARGHIGTELNNKAETILQVEVDKEDKAISVVEAVHIRDRDFEPFAFRINEDVLPELVEPYLSKEKKSGRPTKEPFDPEKEIPEDVHRAAVDAAFANGKITLSGTPSSPSSRVTTSCAASSRKTSRPTKSKNGPSTAASSSSATIPNQDVYPQGLATDERGYVLTDENMATNIPGVYAVGDVRKKNVRQVATAVGDGGIVMSDIERYFREGGAQA